MLHSHRVFLKFIFGRGGVQEKQTKKNTGGGVAWRHFTLSVSYHGLILTIPKNIPCKGLSGKGRSDKNTSSSDSYRSYL